MLLRKLALNNTTTEELYINYIIYECLHSISFFLLFDDKDSVDPFGDVTMQNSGDEMSSGNSDQCPVCLMSLKEQLLGTPNNCPHVFCFECIREWAKVGIQEIHQNLFKMKLYIA